MFEKKVSGNWRLFLCLFLQFTGISQLVSGEDGYRLWLRYIPITDPVRLHEYGGNFRQVSVAAESDTLLAAKEEQLLERKILEGDDTRQDGLIVLGKPEDSSLIAGLEDSLDLLGPEGFVIKQSETGGRHYWVIAGNEDIGVLYGVFHFLRQLQSLTSVRAIETEENPSIQLRVLNHWDNLNRTVERGYAGFSLWDWHKLPDHLEPRYRDYARANASIGINGTVLNNVNSNPLSLTSEYLAKAAALADVFRPYGIRVYLSIKFSAPVSIGGIETADPLNGEVRRWWKEKVEEIYGFIPDFGGFLVKANSEGQPGPQDYGRTHADGANMLAEALAPKGGVVMWRAFVYDNKVPEDRAKQAYNEFTPLDGSFRPNVLVQVKNGPIDFQPREPFHPLFGAMPKTPLMMEFQITQEYLGFATHLVYLAPLWEEVLDADTYAGGAGSGVAKIVDGTLDSHQLSGMAGVSNIGTDLNWTGHTFGQANWYAFGRLAWDPALSSARIAEEWVRLTFSNDPLVVQRIQSIMMRSREAAVDYMTPLGLHHLMARGHHYGPGPWVSGGRADWTSVYYHRADQEGIGFDRSRTGSNALGQYRPQVQEIYSDPESCPDQYLLWFLHLPWDFKMKSGRTLWEELCFRYNLGVQEVIRIQQEWNELEGKVDTERFLRVKSLLRVQVKEARWWRDACLLYFQTFSKRPIPEQYEKPEHTLEELMAKEYPFAPGHGW